jgi:hypothetical protein
MFTYIFFLCIYYPIFERFIYVYTITVNIFVKNSNFLLDSSWYASQRFIILALVAPDNHIKHLSIRNHRKEKRSGWDNYSIIVWHMHTCSYTRLGSIKQILRLYIILDGFTFIVLHDFNRTSPPRLSLISRVVLHWSIFS